jgi:fatty acid desaturase
VNLPHHLQTEYFDGDTHFSAREQHQTARTCLYPRWVSEFIVLNFNYHVEHHMFPDAPWYHLEKIHQTLTYTTELKYRTDPYFSWILQNKTESLDQVLQIPEDTTIKVAA